eukprot:m.42041 g.42041  ORF g.42041 m.42041 type:complete len:344 (+) comp10638_c0_seq2:115-1146(+)
MEAQENAALLQYEDQVVGSEVVLEAGRAKWWQRVPWRMIVFGQIISLCTCSTSVVSQMLDNDGVSIPATQCLINYILLAIVFGVVSVYQGTWWSTLRKGWLKYMGIALADTAANYLIVLAFRYTTIASVQLLDCTTVPFVILLSRFVLKQRYGFWALCSVVLTLTGVAVLFFTDSSHTAGSHTNKLAGDALCVASAALYAVSNVSEEYLLQDQSPIQFLALLGLFGMFFSGILSLSIELDALEHTKWTTKTVGLLVGFGVILFVMYACVPLFLRRSSAALLNMSLLTADAYALVFAHFIFAQILSPWIFLALFLTLSGLVLFNVLHRSSHAVSSSPIQAQDSA